MHELKTVEYVDLDRYLGTWYEIAKYPAPFEKGLVCITAAYSLRPDGNIKVVNSGRTLKGKKKTADGKAWIVDKKTNAKLKVQFFWPFKGDYWIIALDENYNYAVIGEPKRRYLWILCRKSRMEQRVYNELITKIENAGYDISKIVKTPQE